MDTTDSTATPPPSTRESRGLELYRRGGIERVACDVYLVPSCSTRGADYLVDLAQETCECADHKRQPRLGPCKHAYAAMLYRAWIRRAARTIAPVLADVGDE